ncbi:MAG: hypothetical protein WCT39_04230 [Candidatus Margulisiibacteriota bacterium]
MKLIKTVIKDNGEWWVIIHDYSVDNGWLKKFRPIHVFTQLAIAFVNDKKQMLHHANALENKLFSVGYFWGEIKRAIAGVDDSKVYDSSCVKDYDKHQIVISCIEAYLSAIYSVLEISAKINKLIYAQKRETLPASFFRQAKKIEAFSLTRNKWLGSFFDLRREMTHNNSLYVDCIGGHISVEFVCRDGLLCFKPGERYLIDFNSLLLFYRGLFDMLDYWAKEKLCEVDENYEFNVAILKKASGPIEFTAKKAKLLLDLLNT